MSLVLRVSSAVALLVALAFSGTARGAEPFTAEAELHNVAKSQERQSVYQQPDYHAALSAQGTANLQEAMAVAAADPERGFLANVCGTKDGACAGDVRLYQWQQRGFGTVAPVLFTARNGATLAGHVWATKAGPPKRPGIVIVNGSVQASEELYWWAAQTLAKNGYVVITFDPQGQGRSDVLGEGQDSGDGVPSQLEGSAFYDGAQDALDFLLSTPDRPYVPRPSDTSGTSHADKQARRVAAGLNAAFNPLHALLDPTRIGIAGHSYGSQGASWVGQQDARIDAVVAWDNLCDPGLPVTSLAQQNPLALGNGGLPAGCLQGGDLPAPAITKPALGIVGDYVFAPVPHMSAPDPGKRGRASRAYSKAGVPTGSIVIRGGTHLDFSYLPLATFPATLRGEDVTAWYTTAWFDRYVKGDAGADARLLTDRWRDDGPGAAVDAARDGNLYSTLYDSRLDVRLGDGTRVTCENLRAGCPALGDDGLSRPWSVMQTVLRGDGTPDPAVVAKTCTSRRTIRVTYPRRVVTATATAGGHRMAVKRTGRRTLRLSLRGAPAGSIVVEVRATLAGQRGRRTHVKQVRRFRTCVARTTTNRR